MTESELKTYCLSLPGAYEDRPFRDDTVAFRHTANHKTFVFMIYAHGRLHINLKCEPLRAYLLREAYAGVEPGYHMNKRHWNSVFLESDVPGFEIRNMVDASHELTRPRSIIPP
jgi:predicted DNA-binding protein (MmcQ/YjbR family)